MVVFYERASRWDESGGRRHDGVGGEKEEGRKMIGWRAGMLGRYQGEEDGKQSGV